MSHGPRCRSRGPESIPEVAKRGHPVCLQVLIKAGAVEEKDKCQSVYQIALEYAVAKGNVACVKILVEAGADMNGSKSRGRPLIEAVKGDRTECVELLLSKGADVNISEQSGWTALHSAARCGYETCLEVLLKARADVNSIQVNGNTALIEAAKSGHRKCISLLLNGGADVHVENVYEDTALTIASKMKVACNSFGPLVAAGADVNIRDVFGTPVIVDAALKCSDKELQILVDAGADDECQGQRGKYTINNCKWKECARSV